MLTTLAVAVLVLMALQVVLVAIVSAVRPNANIYVTIVVTSLVTAPIALLYGTHHLGEPLGPDGRLYFVLTHLAIGGFLFHFITLPDRSVTLRILVELLLAPGRTLSLDELTARYGVRTMIASRLEQLQEGRCLTIGPDEAITLLPGGQSFGRFVTGGRRLFRITSAN